MNGKTWIEQMRSIGEARLTEGEGSLIAHHQAMQEIRRRRGLEPLPDPTRIEGFDDDAPNPGREASPLERQLRRDVDRIISEPDEPQTTVPPPPEPRFATPLERQHGREIRALAQDVERNILAPLESEPQSVTTGTTVPLLQPSPPRENLVILDGDATFRGRHASLSKDEQASIARIVLTAIERDIHAQLDSLSAIFTQEVVEAAIAREARARAAGKKRGYRKAKNGRRKKKANVEKSTP